EDIIKKIERARVKMEQIKPRSTLPRGKKEGGLPVKLFKGHYTKLSSKILLSRLHLALGWADVVRNTWEDGARNSWHAPSLTLSVCVPFFSKGVRPLFSLFSFLVMRSILA
ncbi:MAG: hypothetical protein ACREYE_04375, partial [Gammaproteobacteria bacterium]